MLTKDFDYANDAEFVFKYFKNNIGLTLDGNKDKASIDKILVYIFSFKRCKQMQPIRQFSDFLTEELPLIGDVDRFVAGVVGLFRVVWDEQCFNNPVYISIPLEDQSPENKIIQHTTC